MSVYDKYFPSEEKLRTPPPPTPPNPRELLADPVNEPAHYKRAGMPECIELIEALGLGYHLGNAFKYLYRHSSKGAARQDIEKARWYLDRWLAEAKSQARPQAMLVSSDWKVSGVDGVELTDVVDNG